MCWCRPEIRTPWCGRPECHKPGGQAPKPRDRITEAIAEIEDRAHYVTAPGGPSETRYFSISETALREALAEILAGLNEEIRDPEAPEHCIPGPGCRHGR